MNIDTKDMEDCFTDPTITGALKTIMEEPAYSLDFFSGVGGDRPPVEEAEKAFEQRVSLEARQRRRVRVARAVCAGFVLLLCSAVCLNLFIPMLSTAGRVKKGLGAEPAENGFAESKVENREEQLHEALFYVEEEAGIATIKEQFSQLLVPSYVPEGYLFQKLTAKKISDGTWKVDYAYEDPQLGKLCINQTQCVDHAGKNVAYEVDHGLTEKEEAELLFQQDPVTGMTIMVASYTNGDRLVLSAKLEEKELRKVYEGLFRE